MNLKSMISSVCSAICALTICAVPAQAMDFQELLAEFDFETGRIAIAPPEGMSPDQDWSIGFVVNIGDRQARSEPISIDWRGANDDALPFDLEARHAYILQVADGGAADAAATLSQYHQISDMSVDEKLDVYMQLSAGFHIDETQAVNICFKGAPAPMDVWVKSSADAPWRRFVDGRSDTMLAHFVSSALQSSCPKSEA